MIKPLITVDEYKEYAGINSIDFDDKIESIILRVSALVKSYCGRNFIDGFDKASNSFVNLIEYTNTSGYYYPQEFPVQEIISVEYSSDMGNSYSSITNFYYDRSKDAVFIDDDKESINAFKITYKGGFQKTPEDLKLACLDLVEYYYKGEYTPRKSTNNNTVEYITTSDLPSHIKRVLDLYRVIL